MMRHTLAVGAVLALLAANARAEAPKPIRLTLTPAGPPTPALRYQLLPDARLKTSGDAAKVYQEVIDQLAKTSLTPKAGLLDGWTAVPLDLLPKEKVRKELAEFDQVCELLDKAVRCDHCEWGVRERLRDKGI